MRPKIKRWQLELVDSGRLTFTFFPHPFNLKGKSTVFLDKKYNLSEQK